MSRPRTMGDVYPRLKELPGYEEIAARPVDQAEHPGLIETDRPDDGPMPHPGPSPDGRVRVALLCPCLNVGGAEAWQLALARHTDASRIEWVGCCVVGGEGSIDPAMRRETEALMPVTVGIAGSRTLARRADVLVTWALKGLDDLLRGMDRPPRVISTCHSPVESPWGIEHAAMASGVDRWVAVSELALPAIPESARGSIPTSVIWNAVDSERLRVRRPRRRLRRAWGVPEGAKVAGYLGRLSAEKDPHAMRRLIGHMPEDWHTVLVGSGFETIEPHPRLHLVGNDPAAGDVLNAFDVLVVPSHYESFGLTIAEGLWSARPVVSTCSGIAKLRPGLTTEIPVGADGETLAAAVLAAHRAGPNTDGFHFAREHLGPARFGREWTDLILEMVPRAIPIAPGAIPIAQQSPGLLSMAGSFVKATVTHVAGGSRIAPPEVIAAREAECRACPHFDEARNSCKLCGCQLSLKRRWADSECPEGRWKAV